MIAGHRNSEWRSKDGRDWRIGSERDAGWIEENGCPVAFGCTLPRVFEAYATLELEDSGNGEALDYTASKVHDAPRTELYAGWSYVLVKAGPDQAQTWRGLDWKGYLPDLLFPADRSWLVTTLWDDDWTCIGGLVPGMV